MKGFAITTLAATVIISVVCSSPVVFAAPKAEAVEESAHHHHHHHHHYNHNHHQCQAGHLPSIARGLCRLGLCGSFEAPFACYAQGNAFSGCLTAQQASTATCLGGCFDLRKCSTPRCSGRCTARFCLNSRMSGKQCFSPEAPYAIEDGFFRAIGGCGTEQQLTNNLLVSSCCRYVNEGSCVVEARRCDRKCSAEFCSRARQEGYHCPHASNPQRRYICSKGKMRGWCGLNHSIENCPDPDRAACILDNPGCEQCCDLAACEQQTCENVQCPPSVCHPPPGRQICPWFAQYTCTSGPSRGGCNRNATHWIDPRNDCGACCDRRTCINHCTVCDRKNATEEMLCGRCMPGSTVCLSGFDRGQCSLDPQYIERDPNCASCCTC